MVCKRILTTKGYKVFEAEKLKMVQKQQEMDAKLAALNSALSKQVADAEARIDQSRKAALGAVQQVASDTVGALLTKLGASADAGQVQAAVRSQAAARGIA
jgi:F0F1-type ATP synthase membrane subunit b/b'